MIEYKTYKQINAVRIHVYSHPPMIQITDTEGNNVLGEIKDIKELNHLADDIHAAIRVSEAN